MDSGYLSQRNYITNPVKVFSRLKAMFATTVAAVSAVSFCELPIRLVLIAASCVLVNIIYAAPARAASLETFVGCETPTGSSPQTIASCSSYSIPGSPPTNTASSAAVAAAVAYSNGGLAAAYYESISCAGTTTDCGSALAVANSSYSEEININGPPSPLGYAVTVSLASSTTNGGTWFASLGGNDGMPIQCASLNTTCTKTVDVSSASLSLYETIHIGFSTTTSSGFSGGGSTGNMEAWFTSAPIITNLTTGASASYTTSGKEVIGGLQPPPLSVVPVPIPGSVWLLVSGLGGLALFARRTCFSLGVVVPRLLG